MRRPQSKTLTGASGTAKTYEVNLLSATPAFELLQDLIALAGGPLAPIFSNMGSLTKMLDKDVEDLKTEFLGDAMRALSEGLKNRENRDTVKKIIVTLAGVTTVEGMPLAKIYEAHFSQEGLAVALTQWLPFAVQVQFDDFFELLGSAIKSAPRPEKKETSA